MMGVVAVLVTAGSMVNDIQGVWATYDNTFTWTFTTNATGVFFEGDRFGFVWDGKWTPDGGLMAQWARNDSGSNPDMRKQRGNEEDHFGLSRTQEAWGRVKFDVVRRDKLGKPEMMTPQWLVGDTQAPVTKPNVTYVAPLGSVLFSGTYRGDSITVKLGPRNKGGMEGTLTTTRSYAIESNTNPYGSPVVTFRLINATTGASAGNGRIVWVPTAEVVKLLRGGSVVPTDRIFIAVNAEGRKRWTLLAQ